MECGDDERGYCSLGDGHNGSEGKLVGAMYSLMAMAAMARIVFVAAHGEQVPALAAALPWLPGLSWLAAALILLPSARRRTQPAEHHSLPRPIASLTNVVSLIRGSIAAAAELGPARSRRPCRRRRRGVQIPEPSAGSDDMVTVTVEPCATAKGSDGGGTFRRHRDRVGQRGRVVAARLSEDPSDRSCYWKLGQKTTTP